jgi:hypothetical protein
MPFVAVTVERESATAQTQNYKFDSLNNSNLSSKASDATTPLLASTEEVQGSSRPSLGINVITDFVIQ